MDIQPEDMTLEAHPEATPKAQQLNPELMTLEQIKEQLALYNRLYYQKRRNDKDFMENKRASAIRHHRRKKLNKMAENGEIELKDIDYQEKKVEEDKNKLRKTKPRKYTSTTYKLIDTE